MLLHLPLGCRLQGPSHGRRRPWRTPAPDRGSSPESWRFTCTRVREQATRPPVYQIRSHTRYEHKTNWYRLVARGTSVAATRAIWYERNATRLPLSTLAPP